MTTRRCQTCGTIKSREEGFTRCGRGYRRDCRDCQTEAKVVPVKYREQFKADVATELRAAGAEVQAEFTALTIADFMEAPAEPRKAMYNRIDTAAHDAARWQRLSTEAKGREIKHMIDTPEARRRVIKRFGGLAAMSAIEEYALDRANDLRAEFGECSDSD